MGGEIPEHRFMIHKATININLWISYKKKFVKVSFVTDNVMVQKNTYILIMKTHYDTPKHLSFEVRRYMKASYEPLNEQTITV